MKVFIEISRKIVIVLLIAISPLFLITVVLLLVTLGVLPGKVSSFAFPVVIIFWVFILFVTANSGGISKVMIKKTGKVIIPRVFFVGKMSNEYFINSGGGIHGGQTGERRYPVFIFELDNVKSVFLAKPADNELELAKFYAKNLNKTVCIEFNKPIELHKGVIGVKYGVTDIPLSKIYVSVQNPDKLIKSLSLK